MSETLAVLDQEAPAGPRSSAEHATSVHNSRLEDKKDLSDANADVLGAVAYNEERDEEPTDEEYLTLRKVSAPMNWPVVAMCIVELAERASYYGSKKNFSNFVRGGLPKGGNGAGAVAKGAAGANQTAGALGKGSVAASAVTSTFTFLSYVIPILGGIISDTRWGRFWTICVGVAVGAVAHILLVIPGIPSVIQSGHAFAPFMIALVILAFASGFIKPCLAPLLCDQSPVKKPVVRVTKSGERVIVDPQATVQRYLLIFYWCINVGSFWMIVTSYTERLVGFWLAFLEPAILYLIVPFVFLVAYKKLYFAPPQGSVVLEAIYVFREMIRRKGVWKTLKGGDEAWEAAKPSNIFGADGSIDEKKVFWDDAFVDEIRQSLQACAVSFILPVFYLADGGIGNMENSQSAAMTLSSIPNDLFDNFNPLCIIVFTPIITYGLYPYFERIGRPIKPMTRISIGFALGTITMIIGAIVQWKVYQTSPCGYQATDCPAGVSPVSLAWQIPLSALPGIGEIFISVTSYELAITRAPARMKSLVYAVVLFNRELILWTYLHIAHGFLSEAIGAAISLALSDVIQDPYLIWPYVALAIANFICIFIFPIFFRHLNEPVKDFLNIRDNRKEGLQQNQSYGLQEVEQGK
ncbi:hypothetical protein P7C73_g866, partial [Tremellales sp. Uapishka_1]